MNEHQYNPHDLEREYDSFTANIGADGDGNETAYLYHPETGKYIGCVTYNQSMGTYTFDQRDWPREHLKQKECEDVLRVIIWLKERDQIKHLQAAEGLMMIDHYKREGGAE